MNNEGDNYGGSKQTPSNEAPKKGWRNVLEQVGSWMAHKDKDKWLEQMRGNFSIVATVIATMTFQMALSPPGSVMSINDDAKPPSADGANAIPPGYEDVDPNILKYCTFAHVSHILLCPGEAVLAFTWPDPYFSFLVSNTICFITSLAICLLLVSGIPLNHRLPIWFLVIGMCGTLTSLTIAYTIALQMTATDVIFDKANNFLIKLIYTWIGLLGIIGLWHTLRLVIWGVNCFRKRSKKAMTQKGNSSLLVV